MNDYLAPEIGLVQNKALGAYLIYKMVIAYERSEKTNSGCPLHLTFLVMPILYQKDISSILVSTNPSSGIRKFTNKFSSTDEKKTDVLLRVHKMVNVYKKLSWDAIVLGVKANMLFIVPETAQIVSRQQSIPAKYECHSIKPMLRGADRLGMWFSRNSLYGIASILKVRF